MSAIKPMATPPEAARVIRSLEDLLDHRSKRLAERYGIRLENLGILAASGVLVKLDYDAMNSPDNSEEVRELMQSNAALGKSKAWDQAHLADARSLAALLIAHYELSKDPQVSVPVTGRLSRLFGHTETPLAGLVEFGGTLCEFKQVDGYLRALDREIEIGRPGVSYSGPGIFHVGQPYHCLKDPGHTSGVLDTHDVRNIPESSGLKLVACRDCGTWSAYDTSDEERSRAAEMLSRYEQFGLSLLAPYKMSDLKEKLSRALADMESAEGPVRKALTADGLLDADGKVTYGGIWVMKTTQHLQERRPGK